VRALRSGERWPVSFAESFEEYAARLGAACTCPKRPWAWDHAEACPVAAAHAAWAAESAELWDRIRSAPSFDPKIFEKAAAGFR